ncbi:hypothetical protein [Capnocytophaga sputigena]|jgi:hypothetical protein|uniref:hypothetical protein n=1 Tax=Capnocytophaga sputigena TaxID=1019 RepID=UPI0028E1DCA9|nr:hypothetical protein [Capnocytophaga sputigena]
MEISALVSTVTPLILPFFDKVGDGIIGKIGEDLWGLLKKAFENKKIEGNNKIEEENLRQVLSEILEEDSILRGKVEYLLKSNNSNFTQNINNAGATIGKLVNISNVNGTINL